MKPLRLLLPILTAFCAISSALADPLFTTNFQSLTAGPLVGQGGWVKVGNQATPLVTAENGMVVAGSNPDSPSPLTLAMLSLGDVVLPEDRLIYIDVKLNKNTPGDSAPGTCAVAIGTPEIVRSARKYIGVVSNRWTVWDTKAVDKDGEPKSPRPNEWFSVRITINPTANQGAGAVRISVKDGRSGSTIPLYFDAAQTNETAAINLLASPPGKWTHLGIMLGGGLMAKEGAAAAPRGGLVDEISISTGEPETW